ncbi:hypothetical protein BT96DRAFT_935732 [Gymnopus androsaceus JB14]|uniref:Uncharacterized protein n=1 Tax=Gymnopus androsaceus JB14 TaxID=1447944 RepID=A0A6A4I1I3_9AGAR|nr:hypothetical protein BT96DRAFT_935732 [Gymnopus androsaceus JB14]
MTWDSQNPTTTAYPVTPSRQQTPSRSTRRFGSLFKVPGSQWSLNTISFGLGVISTIAGYKSNSLLVTVCGVVAILGSFLSFLLTQLSRSRTGALDDRLQELEERLAHMTTEVVRDPVGNTTDTSSSPSSRLSQTTLMHLESLRCHRPPPSSPPAYSSRDDRQGSLITPSDLKTQGAATIPAEYPIFTEEDVRNAFREAAITQGMVPPPPAYNIRDYVMQCRPSRTPFSTSSPPAYSSRDESRGSILLLSESKTEAALSLNNTEHPVLADVDARNALVQRRGLRETLQS